MKRVTGRDAMLLLVALMAAGLVVLLTTTAVQGQVPRTRSATALADATQPPTVEVQKQGSEAIPPTPSQAGGPDSEPDSYPGDTSQVPEEAIRAEQEREAFVWEDLARRMADANLKTGVGTVSNVQENGRRVDGLVSVGGYSVTVTLKDPLGAIKTSQTAWPDASLHYQVNLTTTIRASDTVEVAAGGTTSVIYVDPMSAQLDPDNDRLTGTGPANQTLDVGLTRYQDMSWYTATATVDAAGRFTVTTFYQNGVPQALDIQAGDYGSLHYTHADGNQVYLQFAAGAITVHQNHNTVQGYAAISSVPVSVTLRGPDGSVKAACLTTSDSWGSGAYYVSFYTGGCWGWGDPVIIRGGDTVVVAVDGVSTTMPVDLLTATPNLATDTVSGAGPVDSELKVTLGNCYDEWTNQVCHAWVTTDGAGTYSAGPFQYHTFDMNQMVWVTRTYDIEAGTTGEVRYTNPDANVNYISYAATGVATTIAAGGLRAGATAVLGTAMPGAAVEIWDVTDNALIGSGMADADARFAINVSPPLIYGHTIVAIADGLPSVGHVVKRAVTINGPAVSVSNTVGFYGIAPANSTVEVYDGEARAAVVTTTASAGGSWNAVASLANGTHTMMAKAVEPNQTSGQIVVIVDPTAVAIGDSSGTVSGGTYESDASGENHFQVVGGVEPITITVEILNNPCTVTMSFMGQTITVTAGNTPSPETTFTAVFTNYDWDWGTHEVIVTAVSCAGTPISQVVAEVTLIDPSGYVYDALTGERIQGATATCYYSDTAQSQWVVWEAALYNNQLNPQLTDADGWYGFMVPAGDYYVTASKEGYEDNQTIVYTIPPEVTDAHIALTPLAGYPSTVTLTAEPASIAVGGATSSLAATVVDRFGDPVPDGTVVTFTTDLGSLGSTTVTRPTAGGVAAATLTSGDVAGTATVTARAGAALDTAAVAFTPGAPATVTLDAKPASIPTGGASSTLTATVGDAFDNPVADGTVVTFTTDLGSLGRATITQPTAGGVAAATLTSGNVAGTATVTATAGTAFDTAAVEFTPTLCPVPLTGVSISGRATGDVDVTYMFTATVSPPDASPPITYAWQATGQSPITQTQALTQATVSFAWAISGSKAITVTAENCGLPVRATHLLAIHSPRWYSYLPVVVRKSP